MCVGRVCFPCGPHCTVIYACEWAFWVCWIFFFWLKTNPDCCTHAVVSSLSDSTACLLPLYTMALLLLHIYTSSFEKFAGVFFPFWIGSDIGRMCYVCFFCISRTYQILTSYWLVAWWVASICPRALYSVPCSTVSTMYHAVLSVLCAMQYHQYSVPCSIVIIRIMPVISALI